MPGRGGPIFFFVGVTPDTGQEILMRVALYVVQRRDVLEPFGPNLHMRGIKADVNYHLDEIILKTCSFGNENVYFQYNTSLLLCHSRT